MSQVSDDNMTLRRRHLGSARSIVVKVGSTLLSASPAGRPAAIADEIVALHRAKGIDAVVISSGAISIGCQVLGLDKRPTALPALQAAAAVGQTRLMQNWEHGFSAHGVTTGQVLITHDDFGSRRRFLNARHALRELLNYGVVPVVNENDTVAVDEIKYGDNDLLAALVSNLVRADALIVLTDVDGLHDAHPDSGGKRISLVRNVDRDAVAVAEGPRSCFGSGGMTSKVRAAQAAARHGVVSVVVRGNQPGVIQAALAGDDVGTIFLPSSERMSSRKHWIAYGSKPAGVVVVDAGAHRAVAENGRSLLPAGLVEVRGSFDMGDLVSLITGDGTEFARGLAGYGAADMRKLRGLQSADIESTLGYKYLDELIHRDDLVLV